MARAVLFVIVLAIGFLIGFQLGRIDRQVVPVGVGGSDLPSEGLSPEDLANLRGEFVQASSEVESLRAEIQSMIDAKTENAEPPSGADEPQEISEDEGSNEEDLAKMRSIFTTLLSGREWRQRDIPEIEIFNKFANSEDPWLQALFTRYDLAKEQGADRKLRTALKRVRRGTVNPTTVVYAEFLGDRLAATDPQVLELRSAYDEDPRANRLGIAITLDFIGDPSVLTTWLRQTEDALRSTEPEIGPILMALVALANYPVAEAETLALAAATHALPMIRTKVSSLLYEIGTPRCLAALDELTQDPESVVSGAARRAKSGARF